MGVLLEVVAYLLFEMLPHLLFGGLSEWRRRRRVKREARETAAIAAIEPSIVHHTL